MILLDTIDINSLVSPEDWFVKLTVNEMSRDTTMYDFPTDEHL